MSCLSKVHRSNKMFLVLPISAANLRVDRWCRRSDWKVEGSIARGRAALRYRRFASLTSENRRTAPRWHQYWPKVPRRWDRSARLGLPVSSPSCCLRTDHRTNRPSSSGPSLTDRGRQLRRESEKFEVMNWHTNGDQLIEVANCLFAIYNNQWFI